MTATHPEVVDLPTTTQQSPSGDMCTLLSGPAAFGPTVLADAVVAWPLPAVSAGDDDLDDEDDDLDDLDDLDDDDEGDDDDDLDDEFEDDDLEDDDLEDDDDLDDDDLDDDWDERL